MELGGGEKFCGKPDACLKTAQAHGMEVAAYATGVSYNPWPPNAESVNADIEYASALGVKILMTCGGFMPKELRDNPADYDLFAGNLGPHPRRARPGGGPGAAGRKSDFLGASQSPEG